MRASLRNDRPVDSGHADDVKGEAFGRDAVDELVSKVYVVFRVVRKAERLGDDLLACQVVGEIVVVRGDDSDGVSAALEELHYGAGNRITVAAGSPSSDFVQSYKLRRAGLQASLDVVQFLVEGRLAFDNVVSASQPGDDFAHERH